MDHPSIREGGRAAGGRSLPQAWPLTHFSPSGNPLAREGAGKPFCTQKGAPPKPRAPLGSGALLLFVHALGIVGRLDAPLLLLVHDEAGLHPVEGVSVMNLRTCPRPAPPRESTGFHHARQRQRVVGGPLGVEQLALNEGLVIQVADAFAALEREQRLLEPSKAFTSAPYLVDTSLLYQAPEVPRAPCPSGLPTW